MMFYNKEELTGKSKDELLQVIQQLQQEYLHVKETAAASHQTQSVLKTIFAEADSLANIVRQSTDSIVLTDLDGKIKYVNPMFEQITGYTLAEVKGKKPGIFRSQNAVPPKDFYTDMWDTIRSGQVWKGEFLNRKKNGQDYIEEASIFPIRHQDTGDIIYYGAVKKDVTLQRELEEKLKKSYDEVVALKEKAESANHLKSQFLSHMSHDIRTPLHSIIGFTNLLLKKEQRPEERKYLEKIKISGDALANLISDILDLSKIEAGQLDIDQQPFLLKDLLAPLGTVFGFQLEQKKIRFEIKISEEVPAAACNDRWRLNQVLTNLLGNASKFTRQGSVLLQVDYQKAGDLLVFKLKDTGVGIPAEFMQNIFTPFSQVEPSAGTTQAGTGLGLSICKHLVTMMGGDITLQSLPDLGSEFTVTIPANPDKIPNDFSAADMPVVTAPVSKDKKDYKILVAEDNPVSRELILEQFKDAGFTSVLLAADGQEAVDMTLAHNPALVLMDLRMPVLDGNAAIQTLIKSGCTCPIIILSASALQEEVDESLKAGAVGYITKPIDFDKFFLKIRDTLDTYSPIPASPDQRQESDAAASTPANEYSIKKDTSEKLKTIFLTDVEEKLAIITKIIENAEVEAEKEVITRIAHGYRGNAAHFGLSVLEKSSGELEDTFKNLASTEELTKLTMNLAAVLKMILTNNPSAREA